MLRHDLGVLGMEQQEEFLLIRTFRSLFPKILYHCSTASIKRNPFSSGERNI